MNVPLPYHLTEEELIIDPAAKGRTMDREMGWLNDNISWEDEETMLRIFQSTVLLKRATEAPLGECLATALIWEVG